TRDVLCDADDEQHFAFVFGGQHDHTALNLAAELVGQGSQACLVETVDAAGEQLRAAGIDGVTEAPARGTVSAERDLHLQLLVLARETPQVVAQLRNCVGGLFFGSADGLDEPRKRCETFLVEPNGPGARDGLDAADAGGHAAFARDGERADVAGRAHVRAAAQLHAEAGNRDHAHAITVLLAEQRHRTGCHGFFRRSHFGRHRRVAIDLLVDDALDGRALVDGQRLRVREVEAQPIRRDERARLADVRAQHLSQRGVEQVRGRVIAPRSVAHRCVHAGVYRLPFGQCAAGDADAMRTRATRRYAGKAVDDGFDLAVARQPAGIRDLAARLEIERRPVEYRPT